MNKTFKTIITVIMAVITLTGCMSIDDVKCTDCQSKYEQTIETIEKTPEPTVMPTSITVKKTAAIVLPEDTVKEMSVETITEVKKEEDEIKTEPLADIATQVVRGEWGNGQERIDALKNAGYNPKTVQDIVNDMLDNSASDSSKNNYTKVTTKSPSNQVDTVATHTVSEDDIVTECYSYGCYDENGVRLGYKEYVPGAPAEEPQPVYEAEEAQPVYMQEETQTSYYTPFVPDGTSSTYNGTSGYDPHINDGFRYWGLVDTSEDWYLPEYYDGKTLQIGNYSSVIHAHGTQYDVDAKYSSSANAYDRTCIIDHATQGFDAIKNHDVAYIGGERFHKVATYPNSTNAQVAFYLDDGTNLANATDPGIVMYTCNDWSGVNITLTFWVRG